MFFHLTHPADDVIARQHETDFLVERGIMRGSGLGALLARRFGDPATPPQG
jgi:hypothetical protein